MFLILNAVIPIRINMSDYTLTIGLEIHAELSTKSKMFCGCANLPAGSENEPNSNICPVCVAHPGTLPVINKEAVRRILLIGTAVGGKIADFTEFDRKNYFYPDIPKGYQISQYKLPLVSGGSISGVALTRIHIEEDTARSSHEGEESSLVDFNRAGVPLMELVTEPVMHTAEEAVNFAKELQLLLRYLGVSGANMEKGEMRVEANISVSKQSFETSTTVKLGEAVSLGTKVEVKNINSFRAVGKTIEFEFKRQTELLEKGEKVAQETRGWDENTGKTFSQRLKESAHDYRYFPDPDLPKLLISEIEEFSPEVLKKSLVELPWEKRERFSKLGLKPEDIETYITQPEVGKFFDAVAKLVGEENIPLASNYITSDLLGLSKSSENFVSGKVTTENFADLILMVSKGELSSRGAKDILKVMFLAGGTPEDIAKEKDLMQKNDTEELKKVIEKIIGSNPKVVEEYKAGKESVLQFLIGQGMKETKGSANPEILKAVTLELLK